MKTKKLFILPLLLLSLSACGPQDTATAVDLSTAEGVATLKTSVKNVAKGYSELKLDAISAETEVKKFAFGVTGDVEYAGVKVTGANVGLKNVSGKAYVGVKGEEAMVKLENLGGTLTAKGDVDVDMSTEEQPDGLKFKKSVDESLTISGLGANLYQKGATSYVDYSSAGLRTLLTDASAIANKYVNEITGKTDSAIDLNKMLDDATGSTQRKISTQSQAISLDSLKFEYNDEVAKQIDDMIDSYVKLDNFTSVFALTTYSSGKLDLEVKLDKDTVVSFLSSIAEVVPESAQATFNIIANLLPAVAKSLEADVKLSFNEKGLLVSEESKLNVELSTKEVASMISMFVTDLKTLDIELTLALETSSKLAYNSDVNFTLPSAEELAKYDAVNARE